MKLKEKHTSKKTERKAGWKKASRKKWHLQDLQSYSYHFYFGFERSKVYLLDLVT
jgi:hypothetical protein